MVFRVWRNRIEHCSAVGRDIGNWVPGAVRYVITRTVVRASVAVASAVTAVAIAAIGITAVAIAAIAPIIAVMTSIAAAVVSAVMASDWRAASVASAEPEVDANAAAEMDAGETGSVGK